MTTVPAIAPASAAAERLEILAGIIRERAYHPLPHSIESLAARLEDARTALLVAAPSDGQGIPAVALDAMQEAADLMAGHDFHIPAVMVKIAVAPLTGHLPVVEALNAVGKQLAVKDFDLQRRCAAIHDGKFLDTGDREMIAWAMRALTHVHYKHERLAEAVAADNDRPAHRGKTPHHLLALQEEARKRAAKGGPTDGCKLIAALGAYGIPAWLADDNGVSYVIAGVDRTADEGDAHTGWKVFLYSGESADLDPADHAEPWACALYDGAGEFSHILFCAAPGLDLDAECAHAALCLAAWLTAHAHEYPRT